MKERLRIKVAILKALLAADGEAMPDESLMGAVQTMVFPAPPIQAIRSVGQELETVERLISGAKTFTGVSWTLTTNGVHEAQKL